MTIGREDYQSYYYLWHLIATGVLDADPPMSDIGVDCPHVTDSVWTDNFTRETSKIALIDMGVARHHPNLEPPNGSGIQSQIDWDIALDLASHRFGAKYVELDTTSPTQHLEQRVGHLAGIEDGTNVIPGLTPEEIGIVQQLKAGLGVQRFVDAYNEHYPSHGTGCAGLTSGTSYSADQFGEAGNIAAYFGVDPLSRVVPITTSISPNPEQLIAAFLYALFLDVDVILFPRDVAVLARPDGTAIWPESDKLDVDEFTRLHATTDPNPLGSLNDINAGWSALDKIIKWVSTKIPIVCAAGNDGRSKLIYPASLAADPTNGIIAVGAVSYLGYRSGYSNYGSGLTVVAPSDDGEIYNRYQIRLDRQSISAKDFWIDQVHRQPHAQANTIPIFQFAPQRLVSLDVPGPRGYEEGTRRGPARDRDEAKDDPSGLYAEFGGTSGSSALVAGVISLMQRKSGTKLTGEEVKNKFEALSSGSDEQKYGLDHWYWLDPMLPVQYQLQPDAANGTINPSMSTLFGQAGLLNAKALLSSI
jgi:hypothetical protein